MKMIKGQKTSQNDNLAVYLPIMLVGADDHIGLIAVFLWADVGIRPYNCVIYV